MSLTTRFKILEVIELQLNAAGYTVITYANSSEFLEKIHELLSGRRNLRSAHARR